MAPMLSSVWMRAFGLVHAVILCVLLVVAERPLSGQENPITGVPDRADPDKTILRRGKHAVDDAAIQKMLRDLPDLGKRWADVPKWVAQLASTKDTEQTEATANLKRVGAAAVPYLREAESLFSDNDAKKRARTLRYAIEQTEIYQAHDAAARLLIRRNPPDTAPVLLHYLPFTFDPETEETMWYALERLATKDPKILASLEALLANPAPVRRAFAACLLARHGNAAQQTAAKKSLQDTVPLVRLRAAQGFLAKHDKSAIPTLVDLLVGPAIEIRWQAEELLRWCSATEEAPTAVIGAGEPAASKTCQDAWRTWWSQHEKTLDLATVEQVACRPILLLAFEQSTGRVWLVGSDGVTRHEWTGLKMLEDARYVPGGTILTLEGQPVREDACLAERERNNTIVWKNTNLRDPKHCQRLSNGTVFVGELQTIKPYFYYHIVAPGGQRIGGRPDDCAADWRTQAYAMSPDGRVVSSLFNSERGWYVATIQEYDPTTNTVRNATDPSERSRVQPAVVLTPTLSYLVSDLNDLPGEGRLVEYDFNGKIAWSYKIEGASHATRCTDGNTLACVRNRIFELTPDKRWLAEISLDANVEAAQGCLNLVRFGFKAHPTRDILLEPNFRLQQLATRKQSLRLAGLRGLRDNLAPYPNKPSGTIPSLEKFVNDPDPKVRDAVKQTRLDLGHEEIPRLLVQLNDPNSERRLQAIELLLPYDGSEVIVDALLSKATTDIDPKVRARAISRLGRNQYDPQRRLESSNWQGAYVWAAAKITPKLIELVKDKDTEVSKEAIFVIRKMGLHAKEAVSIYKKIAESNASVNVRRNAIITLGHICHDADNRIYISKCLNENELRIAAAHALAQFGPQALESVDAIIKAFHENDVSDDKQRKYTQSACLTALAKIAPTERRVVELMKSEMSNTSLRYENRLDCALYLCNIDTQYQSTIQYLAEWQANEKQGSTRAAVAEQLRQSRRPLFQD